MAFKLIHFTHPFGWEGIQKKKQIEPRSHPYSGAIRYLINGTSRPDIDVSLLDVNLRDYCKYERYVTAIPSKSLNAWKEYGLLEVLFNYWIRDPIALEFALSEGKDVFVREHKFWSPLYQKVSPHEWTRFNTEEVEKSTQNRRLCLESTTSLEKYDDSFVVPEIWIPTPIPLDGIRVLGSV